MLQWDPSKRQRGTLDYQKGFADHLADAWLYLWRECRHQDLDNERNASVHKYGTKAYWEAEEAAMLEAALNPAEELDWWKAL